MTRKYPADEIEIVSGVKPSAADSLIELLIYSSSYKRWTFFPGSYAIEPASLFSPLALRNAIRNLINAS